MSGDHMISKTKIMETLDEWNFWNRDLPETFPRGEYESEVNRKSEAEETLILKGVRRSSKSTILLNTVKRFWKRGGDRKDILFVNLEDPRFIHDLNVTLLSSIKDAYLEFLNPYGKPVILLDEIRNAPRFEKWLFEEYELNASRLPV